MTARTLRRRRKIALAEFLGTPDPSLPTTGQGMNEKPPTT